MPTTSELLDRWNVTQERLVGTDQAEAFKPHLLKFKTSVSLSTYSRMPRPTVSVASQVHSSLRQGSLVKRERVSSPPSASLLIPIKKSRKEVTGLQTTQSYDHPGVTTVTSALGKALPRPPMSWGGGRCDTSLSRTGDAENVPSSLAETEGSDIVQVLVRLGVAAWELDDVPRQIALGKLDGVLTLFDELQDILCETRGGAQSDTDSDYPVFSCA